MANVITRPLIVLIGQPGSGKGTQGRLLASYFGFTYLATGDLVRKASYSEKQTELNRVIRERYHAGIPQPDEVINELLWQTLKEQESEIAKGLISDMYPLSMGQIKGLEKLIQDFGFGEPQVFFFNVSQEETIRRLGMRKFCPKDNRSVMPDSEEAKTNICSVCGGVLIVRNDDTPEVVTRRYQEYMRRFEPMLQYFKNAGWLHMVNAERGVEEIQEEVRKTVEASI